MIIRSMMTSVLLSSSSSASSSSSSSALRSFSSVTPSQVPIRLILFDAFDTLVKPRKPPYVQYWEEIRKVVNMDEGEERREERGVTGEEAVEKLEKEEQEKMNRVFKEAFKEMTTRYPIYGLHSRDVLIKSPNDWWLQLIRKCVEKTRRESAPMRSRGEEEDKESEEEKRKKKSIDSIMITLGPRLLYRFSTKKGYELAQGVPSVFMLLTELVTQEGGGERKSQSNDSNSDTHKEVEEGRSLLTWKLATNSDERILDVCQSLGLAKYINLEHHKREENMPSPSPPPPIESPCLSYDIGFEKPDTRFFHQAVQQSFLSPHHGSSKDNHKNTDLTPLYAQTLYVGDHYQEDYLGATKAGLQAVWLQRSQPWPSDVSEEERKKIVAVQSMEDIVNIVKRSWSR